MTVTGEWNLDSRTFSEVTVFQLSIKPNSTDLRGSSSDLRLLILSHHLSHFGVPSLYLPSPVSYIDSLLRGPVVISFDLFNSAFANFPIPTFIEVQAWTWGLWTPWRDDIRDHCQRAVTLYDYYRYLEFHPIYFSSFVICRRGKFWAEPFIVQSVPVRTGRELTFRRITYSEIPVEICENQKPVRNGFVLIPPYEQPFQVRRVAGGVVTVVSVIGESRDFALKGLTFVYLFKPSRYLQKLFAFPLVSVTYGNLTDCPQLPTDEAALSKFYTTEFRNSREFWRAKFGGKIASDFAELEPSLDQILSEQLPPDLREVVLAALPDGRFPSCRLPLRLFSFPSLSFFDSDFGPPPPPHPSRDFVPHTAFSGKQLPIPDVIVAHNGSVRAVNAKSVIELWERENLSPISKPKLAHFIVFCDIALRRAFVVAFIRNLIHFYSLFNLGELNEYARAPAYHFHRLADIRLAIQAFIGENPLAEFAEVPLVVIAIGDGAFGQDFRPRANLLLIPSGVVTAMNTTEIRAIAFQLYAQLRGHISLGAEHAEVGQLFCGFRYQPPFVLSRGNETSMMVHVAWDRKSGIAVATDDIGAALSELQLSTIADVVRFLGHLRSSLRPLNVTFSVAIIGEYLFEADCDPLWTLGSGLFVLSIFPCPETQLTTCLECDEDVCVVMNEEIGSSDSRKASALAASAIVIAKGHCAYSMSLYIPPRQRAGQDSLEWIAGEFSKLSWLSVIPGREDRVSAFPPHFGALLRNARFSSLAVSRFEFV